MSTGTLLCTVVAYVTFTPLHEATHRSLSRISWLNETVGRICGWAYLGLFVGFRDLHLEHHKHTNDPSKDPDFWAARGPTWALPLKWLTLDLNYHVAHLKRWGLQSRAHKVEVVVTGVAMTALLVALIWAGWGWEVLWLWLVPLKLSYGLLAYVFDYLPHSPHEVMASVDRYGATVARPSPVLSLPLLNQNLHNIHHLYPAVPFYRYGRIWRAEREALLAHGVEVRSLTGGA